MTTRTSSRRRPPAEPATGAKPKRAAAHARDNGQVKTAKTVHRTAKQADPMGRELPSGKQATAKGRKNGRVKPVVKKAKSPVRGGRRGGRRSLTPAADWQRDGVELTRVAGELPPTEQETTISFLRGGRYAEITTADSQWQKRIESLGVRPRAITTFSDGKAEIRYYDRVPKGYVGMPSAGRGKAI